MKVHKHPFASFSYQIGKNNVVMTHNGGSSEQIFAYAYEVTEDIRYAAYCIIALRKMFRPYPEDFMFFLMSFGGWVPKLIHAINSAVEKYGKETLLKTLDDMIRDIEEKGKDQVVKKIDRSGIRPEYIGRITGYDV